MVSIPDWSRWARLQGSASDKSVNPLQNYERAREEEALRMAIESGYFLEVTSDVLLSRFAENNSKDLKSLSYIRLSYSHIRFLGSIEFCLRLRILCLNLNHLEHIDGLAACRQLIKLDLSGNQLQQLPGSSFWSSMRFLRILLLHDNPLGNINAVSGLMSSRYLTVLTLYDTPLSLKKNYRHHMVNSLWSLKSLDKYVVSDEEIIEDADFRGSFSAQSEAFRINPVIPPEEDGFHGEMNCVRQLLWHVNQVLAHNSPVVILQRYARGLITRRNLRAVISAEKHWASSNMHQWLRENTAVVTEDSNQGEKASVHTPALSEKALSIPTGESPPPASAAAAPPPPEPQPPPLPLPQPGDHSEEQNIIAVNVREIPRPSSPAYSEAASTVRKGPTSATDLLPGHLSPLKNKLVSKRVKSPVTSPLKSFHIDEGQLHAGGTLITLDMESHQLDDFVPGKSSQAHSEQGITGIPLPGPGKRLRITDHRQFFGQIVPVLPDTADDLDDLPDTDFRLRGRHTEPTNYSAYADMIIGRAEAGRMVRHAEDVYHEGLRARPLPSVTRHKYTNNDQRLFARTQGSMAMLALQKWDKLDTDTKKTRDLSERFDKVWGARQDRERAKLHIQMWKNERGDRARNQERVHRREISQHMDYRDWLVKEDWMRGTWRRTRDSALKREIKSQVKFATEFSGHNTSVSQALIKHDRQAVVEDRINERSNLVKEQRETEKEKYEEVRKFLEHQRETRQSEVALHRAELDTKLLQHENERFLAAQTRVEHLKTLRRTAVELVPAAQLSSVPNTDRQTLNTAVAYFVN